VVDAEDAERRHAQRAMRDHTALATTSARHTRAASAAAAAAAARSNDGARGTECGD